MGREFLEIFEEWADSYDDTVAEDSENEYSEVFKGYRSILNRVAELSNGHVLEFGSGTGNLTEILMKKGHNITAIEPSEAMREIARKKLAGKVPILDGDFLHFPAVDSIHTIVSTYAFHHLTDQEKEIAIAKYAKLLKPGGKVVFGDTMYPSKEAYEQAIKEAKSSGCLALAKDLQSEYYSTIPFLQMILEKNGFSVTFKRWNKFVWIMDSIKR
ncbi:putative AdoMet-dependent methyltransferase [Oikeobacillus pervagus]|uniref:Uncharacterized methyltransferase J2S13_000401 n=1 Tax=Oikeobacillus pervagus TaxID=1325931 RepID=A0AAJ1WJD2_9BACI|nr:class I SAM-dependent methyltransferase [Oikeobacillus pervagus]MDQ0214006.1 putative AdoMet-dependent methyltransferase [Oikeobacillus pervagus]